MRCSIGILLLALLTGCTPEVTAETVAAQRFEEFQDALFRKDRSALRKLVCSDARQAVPGLCRADLKGRKRLVVTEVTRHKHEYRVHVDDPNVGGPEDAFYVLTKEDGQLRVDLLTTVRYFGRHTKAGPGFAPGKLSPEQIEQARARHAAPPADR